MYDVMQQLVNMTKVSLTSWYDDDMQSLPFTVLADLLTLINCRPRHSEDGGCTFRRKADHAYQTTRRHSPFMLNISTTDVQKKSQQLYFETKNKPSDFVGTGQGWWSMAGAIGK
jgi:hypothetical protein